jgi:uncharacterized protein YdaU (DUF1376 family)
MSMGGRPWFPFYVGDYLRDTTALDTEQHGAYLLLLMAYWIKGGPLPDDDKILATVAKISMWKWRKILRRVLQNFFQIEDGVWKHKRMDKEIEKAVKVGGVTSKKARKAAQARWGKSDASRIPDADASSTPEAMPGDAQSQPQSQSKNNSSSGLVSINPNTEQDAARESQRVLSNYDFLSDDGSVLITADEFKRLEADLPSIRNIRGIVRDACRRWLLEIEPTQRKQALLSWLRKKHAETSQRQSLKRDDADKRAAFAADRERREQADRALAIRAKYSRRPQHSEGDHHASEQTGPNGEFQDTHPHGGH